MKPAWPIENCPVKPFTSWRLTAASTAIAIRARIVR
jgi:hypothetical protein